MNKKWKITGKLPDADINESNKDEYKEDMLSMTLGSFTIDVSWLSDQFVCRIVENEVYEEDEFSCFSLSDAEKWLNDAIVVVETYCEGN